MSMIIKSVLCDQFKAMLLNFDQNPLIPIKIFNGFSIKLLGNRSIFELIRNSRICVMRFKIIN